MRASTKEHYEKAIESISSLHGNMAVLSSLDTMLKDENSDLGDIEKLIQTDGSLAASIVKLSNKAVFGFGGECENVSQAMQTVGFGQALKLVSSALSKQLFMMDLDAYGISSNDYWKYSYFTATFMELQAKRIGLDQDESYLLGLLHSIGRVVVNELLHVDKIEIFWDRFVSPSDWEIDTIGFSSERAGALLLKNWNFPEEFYSRVEKQSEPVEVADDLMQTLLDYARLLSTHVEDSEFINDLSADQTHLYRMAVEQPSEDILSDIEEAESYVANIHETLQAC